MIRPIPSKPPTSTPTLPASHLSSSEDLLDLALSPISQSPFSSDQLHNLSTPAPTQRTLSTLASRLLRNPARALRHFLSLLQELSRDDSFLRTLLFALALVVALLRRDVRARLRMVWMWLNRRVRETIAMGSKVGYP